MNADGTGRPGERRTDAQPIVVDASAAIALLTDPGDSGGHVAALLRGGPRYAPSHLPVEVTNVLRRWRNAGRLSEAATELALAGFWKLAVILWPFEPLSTRTWQLGADLSAYDAAYVALAEHLDAPLLTLDARLAHAPGVRCRVQMA